MRKRHDRKRRILSNYLILLICVAGFHSGVFIDLMLPVIQLFLSWYHYRNSDRWQGVLVLEMHMFLATVSGLFFEGYLYIEYVSGDAESVLILQGILMLGAVLAFGMGAVTTLLKYFAVRT